MVEVIGDSARGEDFALVRLTVEGDRVVAADASGLERDLVGLTLLEAAAVGGETLAVDALANALAQVFRADPHAERVAVAMSGGVDSAVALLRAGPQAIGVTLRLWTDPAGRDGERACCSPSAVIAAREACHRLGLPHVTLDLRDEFRRAIVAPFIRGYARGETPNPCIACNGSFRFAELLAFAERAGASRLATGHYARIVRHRGRLLLARAVDPRKDQSYMLARLDPRFLDALWFPLGRRRRRRRARKPSARAWRRRGGPRARRRASSQATTTATSSGGTASRAERGPIVDEGGRELGSHDGFWRFTPGQRRGLGVSASQPLFALRTDARTNTVTVGPRASLATTTVRARGRLYVDVERVHAKLRYRSEPVGGDRRDRRHAASISTSTHRCTASRRGQAAVLYENDVVVGAGLISE